MGFYENRIKRIKAEMQKAEADALVLLKPQNTYYTTLDNAIVYSRPYIVVMPLEEEATIIVELLRENHARERSRIEDLRVYHKYKLIESVKGIASDPFALLKEVLEERVVDKGRIGLEMDFIPVAMFQTIRGILPDATFFDASNILERVRMIKDKEEIEMLRRASEISDRGMEAAMESISRREREIDVAVAANNAMSEMWRTKYPEDETAGLGIWDVSIYQSLSFSCMTGPDTRLPTTHKIRDGDVLWLIALPVINCYHTSNERAVIVGKPSEKQQSAFETSLEAHRRVLEMIRPGVTCAEVNTVAADVIGPSDYAKYVKSRTGHAVGLQGHEKPSLSEEDNTVIKENMVLAVEPGFRSPFGIFQHSDTVVITKKGHERLTRYPNDFLTA